MSDPRRLAVALVGLCAFLQLYTPQSLLPLFATEFGAGHAAVSLTVSATTLAVALVAPFAGALADRIGRRRVIVAAIFILVLPTALIATAGSLDAILFWRFLQGLLLPPIFAVAVAYIGEEWPANEVASVLGVYTAGSALGGFLGRLISGFAADHAGWRAAYLVLAGIELVGALVAARYLPSERHFVPMSGLANALRTMVRHVANPRLVVTFGIGFAILFTFVALFTYVSFHLAAPPYSLSSAALGSIFVVYLFGVIVTPWSGRLVLRWGRRKLAVLAIALWCASIALTLAPGLPLILVGLALAAACGFVCQTLSQGFLTTVATTGRSSAIGLYVTIYYIGGSAGALLPAPAYAAFGWPGCVVLVIGVLALMAAAVMMVWGPDRPAV
ncbi:MAG TPA: MFS transporter [Alphaproteobacteria bacterium]|jgi:predicted MFS family arabinose efflux permease